MENVQDALIPCSTLLRILFGVLGKTVRWHDIFCSKLHWFSNVSSFAGQKWSKLSDSWQILFNARLNIVDKRFWILFSQSLVNKYVPKSFPVLISGCYGHTNKWKDFGHQKISNVFGILKKVNLTKYNIFIK